MKSQSTKKRFTIAAAKWACAFFGVLVLFSCAAQAQPTITGFLVNGVSANVGPVGATLTIQGSGFGNKQGFSTATLNGTAVAGNGVRANSWTDTSIVAPIPTNATSGPVVVKVGGKTSNGVSFTVTPAINGLSPVSGSFKTSVTITGTNFATSQGNTVRFNGAPSTASSWSSTKIVAPVPWTTTGKVVVTVGGLQSNGVSFTIAAPTPTSTLRTGTFFVNHTDDPPIPMDTSNPPVPLFSQFCQNTSSTDMSSPCSLREAVVSVNGDASDSSTSPDTIMLPSGTFHLNIAGTGTQNATTGHLDITNAVTIVGMGSTTIIQADSTLQDQVFLIDAAEEGSVGFPVAIRNLVIQGGTVNPNTGLVTSGGAFLWEAGTTGLGQLQLTNVNINGNTATDPGSPGLDDGGGIALFNAVGVTTPAQVTITGSQIQNNQASDAGGGVALKGAISLNMSNSSVTGNRAVGGGTQQGGGLFLCLCNNAPTGGGTSSPSQIQAGSIISGNTAGSGTLGEGGGIFTQQTLTINQGSLIQGNHGIGAGGGIAASLAATTDTLTVTSSTINGNTTGGNGGGIEVDAGSNGSLQLTFNRIAGNSSSTGPSGVANESTSGTITATDNWWGCDLGPGSSPCDTVNAGVNASPYITLTNTASPNSVFLSGTTTLTASILQDSANQTLSVSNLGPLIGLPVSWLNPVNGSLSNQQTTIQPNGTATASLTANALPTASAQVSIDQESCQGVPGNCLSQASVTVQDFSISSPASQSVVRGGSVSYTFTIGPRSAGFTGTVNLVCSVTGGSGITLTGCPSSVTINNQPVNVTINAAASPSATLTTDQVVVTGTNASLSTDVNSGSAALIVQDFSISPPASQSVVRGGSVNYTFVVAPDSTGFTGTINLSCSVSGGSGVTVTCPSSVTINNASANVIVTATASATASLTSDQVNLQGINANVPGDQQSGSSGLNVTDFSVSVAPSSVNVIVGNPGSFTATVSPQNGFTGQVNIVCTIAPSGPPLSGCPSSVNIVSAAVTFTINAGPAGITVPQSPYTLTVQGTSNVVSTDVQSAAATLNAQDFSVSITALQTIVATQTAHYTVTVTPANNLNATIPMSCFVNAPPGLGIPTNNLCPNPVTVNGAPVSFSITVPTTSATPGQDYTVTAGGTLANQSRSATGTLNVENFTISWSPSSQNVILGNTANYTVTVTSQGGVEGQFAGQVNIACSSNPTGPTFSSCGPVTVPAGGSASATVPVATTTSITAQNYGLLATGTSASVPTLSQSATASLIAQNFTLGMSPSSVSIDSHGNAVYTVTATGQNGLNGCITPTGSGVTGATYSFTNVASFCVSPSSPTATTSLTVTVSTLLTPPNQTYTATVTGSLSGQNRPASASVVVGSFGTGTLVVSGVPQARWVDPCQIQHIPYPGDSCPVQFFEHDDVTISLNGTVIASGSFAFAQPGFTTQQIAANLTNSLNSSSSPVTAALNADGVTISVASKTWGQTSNLPLSTNVSDTYDRWTDNSGVSHLVFDPPSISVGPSGLSGGS